MNAPDRLDAIRVPEGVKKVVATKDEKAANAYIYKVMREDHTLGNIMRMELLRDPRVRFAGYKHPHPLDNDILVRVQTAPGVHPTQAFGEAAQRLEVEFRLISSKFAQDIARLREREATEL